MVSVCVDGRSIARLILPAATDFGLPASDHRRGFSSGDLLWVQPSPLKKPPLKCRNVLALLCFSSILPFFICPSGASSLAKQKEKIASLFGCTELWRLHPLFRVRYEYYYRLKSSPGAHTTTHTLGGAHRPRRALKRLFFQ